MPAFDVMRVWLNDARCKVIDMTLAEFEHESAPGTAGSPEGLWCVKQTDGGHMWYYYCPALRGGRANALKPITIRQMHAIQPMRLPVETTSARTTGPAQPPDALKADLLHYATMLADTRGLSSSKIRLEHAESALVASVLGWLRMFRNREHDVTEQLHRATNVHWRHDSGGHVRARLHNPTGIPALLRLLLGVRAVAVHASPLPTARRPKRRGPGAAPWVERTPFVVSPVPTHLEIEKLAVVYWVHIVGASLVSHVGRYRHIRKHAPISRRSAASSLPPCVQKLACRTSPATGGLKNLLRLDVSAIVVNVALQHGVSVDQIVGPSFFPVLTAKFGAGSAGDLRKTMDRDEARGQVRPTTACWHRRGGGPADKLGCIYASNAQCAHALHGDTAADDVDSFSPSDMVAGVKAIVTSDSNASAAGRQRRMRVIAQQILYNRNPIV